MRFLFVILTDSCICREEERLTKLVQQREELLKMGVSDDLLLSEAPYLHPVKIKNPDQIPSQELDTRGVWRMAGSAIIGDSVEDVRLSIDKATEFAKLSIVSRKENDHLHEIEQIIADTRTEVGLAGMPVGGGRGPWGGSLTVERSPAAPQYFALKDWAAAAADRCVVVLMILPDHPCADGPIQDMLDGYGVPYTGSPKIAADLCNERPELLRSLTDAVNYDGSIISAPPAHSISALELRATCQSQESADDFFSRLFGQWENKTLVIRPARGSGLGALKMTNGYELMLYNYAVQNWMETIDESYTNLEQEDIRMPLPPPTQFVIEPFLMAKPINTISNEENVETEVFEDPSLGKLTWPSTDSWLEVRGCLLGGLGSMRCLSLTTPVVRKNLDDDIESVFDVTPPPESILSQETANDTMLRLQLVGDRLGLSGAAEITLLVNTKTGEIVVNEVNVHPDISIHGLLIKQAALLSPPMSHVEVLRELLKEAMSRGEEPFEGDSIENGSLYSTDEFSASVNSLLDAPDAPNPTQNYFGDPYLKVEEGYQYGFEGFSEEAEDSDDGDGDEDFFDSGSDSD